MTPLEKKLASHRLPGIAIRCEREARVAAGRSKLGGHPDVPEEFVWPTATRKGSGKSLTAPLAFLAQVDLGEAAKIDRQRLLPRTGRLLFFTLDEVRVYRAIGLVDGKAAPGATAVVYVPADAKLVRREAPAGLDELVGPESRLRFAAVSTWPQSEGTVIDAEVKLTKEEREELATFEVPPALGMLGHPLGCEFPIGRERDARLLLSLEAKESRLPWDLFGRNGFIFFRIREADLREGRWESVTHKEW